MKNFEYQLYWEDIGERMVYAELDDYSWKLAENMFGYTKQHALYIYHHGKLAAFYTLKDAVKEALVGYSFYTKKYNREKVIALKYKALYDARTHIRNLKKHDITKLTKSELTQQILQTLDAWHKASSTHFLSQPQFFLQFEKLGLEHKYGLEKVGKARFKTRVAFSELWDECRSLFREYGKQYDLTPEEAESLRYSELQQGIRNPHILKARAKKFVMLSNRHKLQIYTGNTVNQYINKYEKVDTKNQVTGMVGNKGKVRAKAFVIKNENLDFKNLPKGMKKGMVLIVQNAWPELTQYFTKASAIVANEGGITSHGTIVAREMNIPCIVRTNIGTKVFKTGDLVEVDANNGIVKKIK